MLGDDKDVQKPHSGLGYVPGRQRSQMASRVQLSEAYIVLLSTTFKFPVICFCKKKILKVSHIPFKAKLNLKVSP